MTDRLLTWSTITSRSLTSMILSRIMSTFSLSIFEMIIFRNSILSGTEYYWLLRKSHLKTSWKIVQFKNTRVWKTQDRIGIVWPGDSISKKIRNWLNTNWKRWWRKVSSKTFEIKVLTSEMEIMKETSWTRSKEQNNVYKEFLEIVVNGSFRHDINKCGKVYTIKSVFEIFHAAEWAKIIESPKSQRQKSQR